LENYVDSRLTTSLNENSEEALLILNAAGRIIFKNTSFDNIFKLRKQPYVIHDILESVHPIDKDELLKILIEPILLNDKIHIPLIRIIEGDMILHYTEAIAYNILQHDIILALFRKKDVPLKINGFSNEMKNPYCKYFNTILDGLLILDKECNIYDLNETFAEKIGYSIEEIKELKNLKLLTPHSIKHFCEPCINIDTETPIHFDVEHYHKQGHIVSLKVKGRQFKLDDKNLLLLQYCDFSGSSQIEEALRESEKKYKDIIDNLIDIYYRTDVNGNLIMASPSCLEMFGYSRLEEVLGQPIEILYPKKEERSLFIDILKKTGKVKSYRTSLLKKDGSIIYVETNSNLLFDKEGNYAGVEGTVRDVTDRMRAEQALKESELSLREINATKDKLLSIIAHDLKSPFTSIIGFSELLTDNLNTLSDKEIIEFVKHIGNSAKNTLLLLDNLLTWAKTQTGQTAFNPVSLNLKIILLQVISVLSPSARIKNISINHQYPEEVIVYADQNMLQTILRNLISNAIKFTRPAGHIYINIHNENQLIEIIVSDDGVGMEQSLIDSLFRLEKSSGNIGTEQEKGSGLGLIICKDFVERHGGKIWAESEQGKGSKFHFTLPGSKNVCD
jgi:PAS domain S-box-containing protein